LEKDIAPIIGREWGYALLEAGGENITTDELLIIKTKDTISAYEKLESLKKRLSISNLAGYSSFVYKDKKINKLALGNSFPLLLGSLFKRIQSPYFVTVGEYIIFSQTISSLE